MGKQEYISELSKYLTHLTLAEQQEILRDVDEHFHEASKAGRSDDSAMEQLGKPKIFAQMMIAETKVNRIHQATSFTTKLRAMGGALLAVLVLTPFNFFFVFFPLLIATIFIMSSLPIIAFLVISIPVLFIAVPIILFRFGFHFFLSMGILFLLIGWCGFATLIISLFYYLTVFYFKAVITIFNWNIRFIKHSMKVTT